MSMLREKINPKTERRKSNVVGPASLCSLAFWATVQERGSATRESGFPDDETVTEARGVGRQLSNCCRRACQQAINGWIGEDKDNE